MLLVRIRFGVAVLMVTGIIAAAPSSASAQSAVLVTKATNLDAILEQVRTRRRAHIIVEFSVPDTDIETHAGLRARTAAVQATQDSIINATLGRDIKVSRMRISPMFATLVNLRQMERLAADPRVVKIYPNQFNQVHLNESLPLIKANVLRSRGGNGNGQIVAIIDTGVKRNHEFLKNKVLLGACFTNAGGLGGTPGSTCPNGQFEQIGPDAGEPCVGHADCTHGTHVAGIAAGRNTSLNGSEPIRGVAPNAKLLAINVFTVFSGTSLGAFDSDILLGEEFVFSRRNFFPGMKIASANMSLGNSAQNTTNCDASSPHTTIITKLRNQKIAMAIASGNNGHKNGVSAPGCVSKAITVGASSKTDVIASFSNMGSGVDVMAPGVSILSSVLSGSGYAFFSGTSMAAPHIAGAVAALRTLHPDATPAQIEKALKKGPPIVDDRVGGTFTRRRSDLKKADDNLTAAGAIASVGPSVVSVRPAAQ